MTGTRHTFPGGPLAAAMLLAACGGSSGDGEVVVVFPGDGLPLETYGGLDVADVDGDGLRDLVAASSYDEDTAVRDDDTEERLNLFLQIPAAPGTFAAPSVIPDDLSGTETWTVIARDLTMDGGIDVVAQDLLQWGFRFFEHDSQSSGRLLPAAEYGVAGDADEDINDSISVGDVDGDLFADIVITADNSLIAYLQDSSGPGSFLNAARLGTGTNFVTVFDVDADGLSDILTFREVSRTDDSVLYYRQNPLVPGSFLAPIELVLGVGGDAIGIADVDGDDRRDIVVFGHEYNDDEFDTHLVVYRQITATSFSRSSAVRLRRNSFLNRYSIDDLDGDGDPEIVIGHNTGRDVPNRIEILSRDAGGSFVTSTLLTVPEEDTPWAPRLRALRVADLNGDRQPDIVVTSGGLYAYFQVTGQPGAFGTATRIASQR